MKFLRPILAAIAVFAATFLVLTWWLHLQSVAAAVAAGFSAIGTLLVSILALWEATLRVDKLHLEIERLKNTSTLEFDKLKLEVERLHNARQRETQRIVSPSIEEMDRLGLNPLTFVSNTREQRLPDR